MYLHENLNHQLSLLHCLSWTPALFKKHTKQTSLVLLSKSFEIEMMKEDRNDIKENPVKVNDVLTC